MEKNNIQKAISSFRNRKILVLGDIMLDQYTHGNVSRISPEAPIPILHLTNVKMVPGGAANVAFNIASLGGKVFLSGVVGNDERKKSLLALLRNAKINISGITVDSNRQTSLKHRFVTNDHQLLRLDDESITPLKPQIEKNIIKTASQIIPAVDIVIISDYAKGLFSKKLAREIIKKAKKHKKIVVADIKPKNSHLFKGIDVLVPNLKEAEDMSGSKKISNILSQLKKRFNSDIVLKRGHEGMTILQKDSDKPKHFPAKRIKVYDVSGAGDTVISVLALGLASGLDIHSAGLLSNYAGGIVVQKPGTSIVLPEELTSALEDNNHINNVKLVPKLWGHEKWLENNEKYCCKILSLNKGYQCSLHYHKEKDEMFLITKGHVRLELGKKTINMNQGHFIRIPPGVAHRFSGITDSEILEVSTHHDDKDSYRLEKSKKVT